MKKIMPFIILFICLTAYTQEHRKVSFDLTVSLGSSILVKMLSGTDHQLSPFGQTNFFINIPLKKNFFMSTGIGYENNRHLVDGSFSKVSGDFNYELVPPNYTQNEILMDYINLPILVKKNLGESVDRNFNLGIGPVLGYLVDARQKAKINGNIFKSDIPVENKLRYGVNLDFDLKRKFGKNKMRGVFGWGLYCQLSKNLRKSESFIPLTGYLRFGMGI